jgi:chemotaxis signal transduction protein
MTTTPALSAHAWCVLRAGELSWRVPAAKVLDIVFWPRLTRVPLQPADRHPDLLGVFEWQNTVVPVFDIAGLPHEERARVVIVRAQAAGKDVPLGIAVRDAAVTDDPEPSNLLVISELTAPLTGRAG